MPPLWNSRDQVVHHETDSSSFAGLSSSIGLDRPNTDSGQCFCTMTRLHQAEQRANTRVRRAPETLGVHAVILSLLLSRQWLAGLETLVFARATIDFWDFVTDPDGPDDQTLHLLHLTPLQIAADLGGAWNRRLTAWELEKAGALGAPRVPLS